MRMLTIIHVSISQTTAGGLQIDIDLTNIVHKANRHIYMPHIILGIYIEALAKLSLDELNGHM